MNSQVDTNSPDELSYSFFDRPHHVNAVASYVSPMYGRFRTHVTLTYQGDSGTRFSYTMRESSEDFNGDGSYLNEFDLVAEEIRAGKTESSYVPRQATIDVLEIMDECRRQMGLVYPFEK